MQPQSPCTVAHVCPGLAQLRTFSRSLPPTHLLLAMFVTALALTLSSIAASRLFRTGSRNKSGEKQGSIPREEKWVWFLDR